MVIFQERYQVEELSDKLSEEEYIDSIKRQIKKFHKHKDGSPVQLEESDDMKIFTEMQREFKPVEEKKERKVIDEEPVEAIVKKPKKKIYFDCNCGQKLAANQKGNSLNVTYLDSSSVESGYAAQDSNAAYDTDDGNVSYNDNKNQVNYGGK